MALRTDTLNNSWLEIHNTKLLQLFTPITRWRMHWHFAITNICSFLDMCIEYCTSTQCTDTWEVLSAEDQWKRYTRIVVSTSFCIQSTCETRETLTWNNCTKPQHRCTFACFPPPLIPLFSLIAPHRLLFIFHFSLRRPYLYLPSCWTPPAHVDESIGGNPQGRHRCCHWGMYPAVISLATSFLEHMPPLSYIHTQTHPLFPTLTHTPLNHPLSTHPHVCQYTLSYMPPPLHTHLYSHLIPTLFPTCFILLSPT